MQIVSVVTLLLGSIFAFSLVSAQNLAGLSSALAQLAQQLAKESRNNTITVGNNSVIVSGVSSANANAHINRGNNKQGWNNDNGYLNGYYNNYGYGYWRGVPEEENLSAEEAALDEEERREREEEQRELAEEGNLDLGEEDDAHDLDAEGNYEEALEEEHEEAHEEEHNMTT